MSRAWLLGCVLTACTHDVRLGTVIDAPSDANNNPFSAGSYAITFLDPAMTNCQGALSGMEAQFSGVTRAQESLVNGNVAVGTPDGATLTISGSPIASGWGVSSVSLAAGVDGLPANLWAVVITTNFGPGPDSTMHDITLLAFDSTTATSPNGVEGEAGIGFDNSSLTGDCTVTFGALLQKQ